MTDQPGQSKDGSPNLSPRNTLSLSNLLRWSAPSAGSPHLVRPDGHFARPRTDAEQRAVLTFILEQALSVVDHSSIFDDDEDDDDEDVYFFSTDRESDNNDKDNDLPDNDQTRTHPNQ
jgi:hypothetical protein